MVNLASEINNNASTSKHSDDYKYKVYIDPAAKLIKGLYRDRKIRVESPFILPDVTKDDYLKLFRDQIAIEEQCFTKIRNVARRSRYEPMEKLIKDWEWREHFEDNLTRVIHDSNISRELMAFFNRIDVREFSDLLISLLFGILCRGQTSISISELDEMLPKLIANLNRNNTLKSLNDIDKINLEKIFEEYIQYYIDEKIPRRYTIRDWWYKCASKYDFSPEFVALLASFEIPMQQVSHMIISFIIDHCEFPLPVSAKSMDKKSRKWVKAFSIEDILLHKQNPHEGVGMKADMCKMFRIHPAISSYYILKHQFEFMYLPSHLLPMKVPPRPWLDKGAYGPNYTFQQNLVRKLEEFPDMDVNMEILKKRITSKEQARPFFDALNLLGATAWKINETMLDHTLTAMKMSYRQSNADFLKHLSIPRHPKSIWILDREQFAKKYMKKTRIQQTEDPLIEVDIEKEFKKHMEERDALIKYRNEQNSLWCWLMYRLILAKHYTGQTIYFPHNIDFRGRTYPISPQINHMGDDLNRGLLKFAKGKKLGEDGFRWLKLHCVNITGMLKRNPLNDRLQYAEEHLDEILDSANRPFSGGDWWWKMSEEPWQTLAACTEIRDAIRSGDPHNFCSHLPIHQDGSCNGLQHYAALGRDLHGAREVNLLPADRPQDIYSSVVESVEKMRIEDERNADSKFHEIAQELRKHLPEPIERKVIKQTIMTTVYGVTQYGAREQIRRQLLDKNMPKTEASKFSVYLARRTFDGLTDAFQNSIKLMDWFKSCAGQILKLKRPLEWITPLGLPVIQPYVNIARVDDGLCYLPVPHKQKNAFPPNFVHSLDSTHMMLTALYCARQGVTFAAIHDCYWTHACDVDEMNRICREQFIALHEQPIIEDLSAHFLSTYLTGDIVERMPKQLKEKMEETFKPPIEPGELDINEVRNSTYFFS